MSSLKDLIAGMVGAAEIASIEGYLEVKDDPITSRLLFELTRANTILDANKNKIFMQHLNLSTRADAEKAAVAYTPQYFLELPITLEAVAELVSALKDSCIRLKAKPPRSWDDIINGIHSTENLDAEQQEDEAGYRFKPNL